MPLVIADTDKPSTFTFIGRHMCGLSVFLRCLPSFGRIELLGSGPLEPWLVLSLSKHDSLEVHAIEVNASMCEVMGRMREGEFVSVQELGLVCHNHGADNEHLSDQNLIEYDLLNLGRLVPTPVFRADTGCIAPASNSLKRATIVNDDVLTREFNVPLSGVFAGALLVNLRRIASNDRIIQFLSRLCTVLAVENGPLIVTITPADFIDTQALLVNAGFHIKLVACETLAVYVNEGNPTIRGDYIVVATPKYGTDMNHISDSFVAAAKRTGSIKSSKPNGAVDFVLRDDCVVFTTLWVNGPMGWAHYSYSIKVDPDSVVRWRGLSEDWLRYDL